MEFSYKKCDYEWYFYGDYYDGSRREKSGALRQADHCIKQGRDILIPYSLLQSSLLWPRKYIQKGAHTQWHQLKDLDIH